MSYYTYFYPQKDLFENNSKRNVESLKMDREDVKLVILTSIIDGYYMQSLDHNFLTNIKLNFNLYKNYTETLEKLHWQQLINNAYSNSDNTDNSVAINYADADSKYALENRIEECDESYDDYLESLLILTRIKFKAKSKEERYAEDEEDEMQYLRYTYVETIKETLNSVEDNAAEKIKNLFMLKCFDTKKEEKDILDEEDESSNEG